MEQHFVYSFPKNEDEEIRFSLREFKDRLFIDIRLWFQTKEGEFMPTKKGLTLSAGFFAQLETGIEKLSELLTVKGGVR